MQTCLEIKSMAERHTEEARNDYGRNNQYNESHPDALATGDAQGKGTGSEPSGYSVPNFSPVQMPIDLSRYDTHILLSRGHNNPGNGVDNSERSSQIFRSRYSVLNPYCINGTFSEYATYEGQDFTS